MTSHVAYFKTLACELVCMRWSERSHVRHRYRQWAGLQSLRRDPYGGPPRARRVCVCVCQCQCECARALLGRGRKQPRCSGQLPRVSTGKLFASLRSCAHYTAAPDEVKVGELRPDIFRAAMLQYRLLRCPPAVS